MAAAPNTWTIILRCRACREKFTLKRLTRDRVLVLPLVAPCPHCSARPRIAAGPDHYDESRLHRIIDLREEAQGRAANSVGFKVTHPA